LAGEHQRCKKGGKGKRMEREKNYVRTAAGYQRM